MSVHTYFRVYTNNVRFHVLINNSTNTRVCRITKPLAYFSDNSAAAVSVALQSKSSLRLLRILYLWFQFSKPVCQIMRCHPFSHHLPILSWGFLPFSWCFDNSHTPYLNLKISLHINLFQENRLLCSSVRLFAQVEALKFTFH